MRIFFKCLVLSIGVWCFIELFFGDNDVSLTNLNQKVNIAQQEQIASKDDALMTESMEDMARSTRGQNMKSSVKNKDFVSQNSTEFVDKVIKKLQNGNIAFNVPSKINISSSEILQCIVSVGEEYHELIRRLTAKGDKEGAGIKVSNRMEADLVSSDFDITNLSDKVQLLSSSLPVEWKWSIKPRHEGVGKLFLNVSAIVDIGQNEKPLPIKSYTKEIEIEVTAIQILWDFIKQSFVPIISLFIGSNLGFLWEKLVTKKNKAEIIPHLEG